MAQQWHDLALPDFRERIVTCTPRARWLLLTLLVVGRQGRQMFVQLQAARESDKHTVRKFKSLDAAVRAAGEIGFDVRSIGIARLGQKSLQRGMKALGAGLAQMFPGAD